MEHEYNKSILENVPEDWETSSLCKTADIYRGGSPRPIQSYLTESENGINWIKIGDVGINDKYITKTEEKITPEGALRSREVYIGDFILSNSMSFGRPYILAINGCIHDGWLVIQNYNRYFCKDFLYYLLSSGFVYHQYIHMAAGSSIQNLNKDKVGTLEVVIPPLPEQERIAEALSDMDALIVSLEKLIAKKKAIKQGAMQRLLTGKTRLPGFEGEWNKYKLGDLGKFIKGSGISRDESNSGTICAVRYGELYTKHNEYIVQYFSHISKKVSEKAIQIFYGDILFAASGETKEEIGKCAAIIGRELVFAGGDILVFRPDCELDPVFMGTYLNLPQINSQRAEKGQGDAIVHIHADALASINITIPTFTE